MRSAEIRTRIIWLPTGVHCRADMRDYREETIIMKNKRTSDYIAEAIQNEILSGRMEAGQPLRQEELADLLGYSRIPVREALQTLEAQGLARRLETRHVVVADFSGKVMEEIYGMICGVEQKALTDLLAANVSWQYQGEENSFHEFIIETVPNEFFRKLLETSLECYIRFAISETQDGKARKMERENLLQTLYQGYQNRDEGEIAQCLGSYYRMLTDHVTKERRMTHEQA